jgi:hypothetical protein
VRCILSDIQMMVTMVPALKMWLMTVNPRNQAVGREYLNKEKGVLKSMPIDTQTASLRPKWLAQLATTQTQNRFDNPITNELRDGHDLHGVSALSPP